MQGDHAMTASRHAPVAATFLLTAVFAACVHTPDTGDKPLIAGAHWHHVHINSVDPDKSIAYYGRHFNAEAARFAGDNAVKTQNSWLLFDKVDQPASIKMTSAIWHIGWGAPDPQAEFERQKALGNTIFTPLTDISRGLAAYGVSSFFFMYVASPDRTLIELNTAPTNEFGHLHLFSADPRTASEFYVRFFGATPKSLGPGDQPTRLQTAGAGFQIGSSWSLQLDNVNIIISPVASAQRDFADDWKGLTELQSPRGGVNDHIGISVSNLDRAIATFSAQGVPVLQQPATLAPNIRHAFVEGPDRIAIELIEDRSGR